MNLPPGYSPRQGESFPPNALIPNMEKRTFMRGRRSQNKEYFSVSINV